MDSSSLDSVLSGQTAPEVIEQPAQVETPAPEVQETPEVVTGDEPATPAEPQKEDPLEKHRKGLEQAASAERKRRQEAENQVRTLREQLDAMRMPQAPAPQAQPTPSDIAKPTRAQYESEDEWLDARDAWRDQQRERQWQQAQVEQAEQVKREKTESVFAEAMKLPGFDLQSFARLPVPEKVAEAILESDASPQLVHFLAANPAEAHRIAGLSETRQVKEIARIEDRLLAAAPAAPPEPKDKPRLPETLTQTRNAKGQFEPAYSGPTPLTSIL